MKIDVEKFLTITALLATTTVGACTVTSTTKVHEDGTGGSGTGGTDAGAGGSATGGSGGAGGSATGGSGGTGGDAGSEGGSGGTGGDAGSDGGNVDASTDAGTDATTADGGGAEAGACLGDVAPAWSPPDAGDAGLEGVDRCELLPYAQAWCQPDAGGEGHYIDGYGYCGAFQLSMRPGVFDAFAACLEQLPVADPCSPTHEQAVRDCFDGVTARACARPLPGAGDAGMDVCDTVAAGCQEITAAKCREVLSAFSDTSLVDASVCLAQPVADGGSCATAFWGCVPPYGLVR